MATLTVEEGVREIDGVVRRVFRAVTRHEDDVEEHFVDASTGSVRVSRRLAEDAENRQTHFDNLTPNYSVDNVLVREVDVANGVDTFYGSWPGTSQPVDVGVAATYSYMWNVHGRDGWDNAPGSSLHRMLSFADYNTGRNAAWLASPFFGIYSYSVIVLDELACTDIMGHEWHHAVQTAESVAWPTSPHPLNESIADMFGELVERDATGTADWMIGTGGSCAPLRNITAPESGCATCTAPVAPANYANYGRWGDVPSGATDYPNSHITTHAGYLLARDTTSSPITHSGISVQGIGDDFDSMLYDLVTDRLDGTESYSEFATDWKDAAYFMFGGESDPRTRFAADAIDSVGLWTGSAQYVAPRTVDRMAIERMVVQGSAVTMTFWRDVATDEVQERAYPCTLAQASMGICSTLITGSLGKTQVAPAAANYTNKIYVFYVDAEASNTIRYYVIDGTGAHAGPFTVSGSPQTTRDVAAAVYNGALYIFYREDQSTQIRYRRYTSAGGWSTEKVVSNTTSATGPAVAVLGDRMHVFYGNGTGANNLRHAWTYAVDVWTAAPVTPGLQGTVPMAGSPAAFAFQNRIHVAAATSDGRLRYASYCRAADGCTYRPDEWTNTVVYDDGTIGRPTLFADPGLTTWGGTGYGPYLYLLWSVDNIGGVPLSEPLTLWNYRRSE